MWIKVPTTVKKAIDHEAREQQRHPAEVVRNFLMKWEKETRVEREEKLAEAGGGKRKRA